MKTKRDDIAFLGMVIAVIIIEGIFREPRGFNIYHLAYALPVLSLLFVKKWQGK